MARPSSRDNNRVPTEPIARLVRAYIAKQVKHDKNLSRREVAVAIAESVGYDHRNFLTRVLREGSSTIDRALADRILCAIGCVEAWHTEPSLRDIHRFVPVTDAVAS